MAGVLRTVGNFESRPAHRRACPSSTASEGSLSRLWSRPAQGSDLLQPLDEDEDRATLDGVARGVELVSVQPRPTVVGRPVMHPDHAEQHRFRELDAGSLRHAQDITGAR